MRARIRRPETHTVDLSQPMTFCRVRYKGFIYTFSPGHYNHPAIDAWFIQSNARLQRSMCFKNLPIEFDAHGHAYLREDGEGDPFSTAAGLASSSRGADWRNREDALEEIVRNTHAREFNIDPVTRVAGALAFHTTIDLQERRVLDARTEASLFRGYELILKQRDPLDAIHISSRACGVCRGVHAIPASQAFEMAYDVRQPQLAVITHGLGQGAEVTNNHSLHLFLLAGPDYSEAAVSKTTPSLWRRAQQTAAAGESVHGMKTVAEIMTGLNPLRGHLYLEALQITRAAREMATFTLGKYPHPSTIYPGGVGIEPTMDTFNQVLGRINRLIDYSKKVAKLWDDLVEFFYEAQPEYRKVGEMPANLMSTGMWDDPERYDGSYARCSEWGERRPAKRNWKERYTWATAPRWDREVMETGPLARQWISAVAGKLQNEFIRAAPGGLEMDLPKFQSQALRLSWRIPERPNALERNRARAYHIAYCGLMALTYLLRAFDYVRRGDTRMSTPYTAPDQAIGAGFWEAGRGTLTHHVIVERKKVANYQIITPSTWMASPRDPFGVPGPYEMAVMNTPLLEEFNKPEDFTGIDILRTIRSFDPCMPCAVHLYAGGRVWHRDATTCACGAED